LHELKNRSC